MTDPSDDSVLGADSPTTSKDMKNTVAEAKDSEQNKSSAEGVSCDSEKNQESESFKPTEDQSHWI